MDNIEHWNTTPLEGGGNRYHYNDDRMLAIVGAVGLPGQSADKCVRQNGGQVARVEHRIDQRHRAHGPVAAQVAGEQQQPEVERGEVVVGELARRTGGHRGGIVEPGGNRKRMYGQSSCADVIRPHSITMCTATVRIYDYISIMSVCVCVLRVRIFVSHNMAYAFAGASISCHFAVNGALSMERTVCMEHTIRVRVCLC